MAVVFISPKQRQKMFFIGITAGFLLFLVIISLGVFLAQPKEVSPGIVFNKAKVDINMSVFDSAQFKNLQAFPEMDLQYSYVATAKNKAVKTGFISAPSEDQARAILSGMGLNVGQLTLIKVGRDDPFTPYYQQAATPVTKTTTPVTKITTNKVQSGNSSAVKTQTVNSKL